MALNEEIGKTKEYIKIGSDFKAGDTFDRSNGSINRVTGADQSTVDQRKGNLAKGTELYNIKNSTSIPVASPGSIEPDVQKRCYIVVDKCKYELITTYLKSKQQINIFLIGNQLDYNPHYINSGGFESSNHFYTLVTSLSNYTMYINSWKFNNSRNLQNWSFTLQSAIFISKFEDRINQFNYTTNTSILRYGLQGKSFLKSPVIYFKKRDYVEKTNFIANNLPDMPAWSASYALPYICCNCYTALGGNAIATVTPAFYYFYYTNSKWTCERYKNGSSTASFSLTKPPCINGIYFAFITNSSASIQTNNGSDAYYNQPLDYSGLKINSFNYSNITSSSLIAAYPSIDKNYILLIYWYNNSFLIYKASFEESGISKTVKAQYESETISSLSDFSKDNQKYSFAICENTNSLIMYFCYKNNSENHPLYRLSFIK